MKKNIKFLVIILTILNFNCSLSYAAMSGSDNNNEIALYKKGKKVQDEDFRKNGTPEYKAVYDKNRTIIGEEYFYANGQLQWKWSCEGEIENDICPYEEQYEYYENGQLAAKATFKNGEVVNQEAYKENGEKIDASNY